MGGYMSGLWGARGGVGVGGDAGMLVLAGV